MHSSDPIPEPPATGAALLRQLGRLVVRARSPSETGAESAKDRVRGKASTSEVKVVTQPPGTPSPCPRVEALLDMHVQALWTDHIPVSIEVLLAPDCKDCYAQMTKLEMTSPYEKTAQPRCLLLEKWTVSVFMQKNHESPPSVITSRWLLSAIRSQLHFSQLSAWIARLSSRTDGKAVIEDSCERRRKLSRETCNFKKLEANCDEKDLPRNAQTEEINTRKLNVLYSIKIPGESYKVYEFVKAPTAHNFPLTDIGDNVYLKVVLESLPRIDDIPTIKCSCVQAKRRPSKDLTNEDIANRLKDLTLSHEYRSQFSNTNINSNVGPSIRANLIQGYVNSEKCNENLVDDRLQTICNESGKHRCYDEEEIKYQETKKLDERRLKEIAKYKRRLRKESKLRKIRDGSSESNGTSEGEGSNTKSHTSIPILQASRFDRLRAIGCYRNQTYLTLPASRIEPKTQSNETKYEMTDVKKTQSVATQTDSVCRCGSELIYRCEGCETTRSDDDFTDLSQRSESGVMLNCDNNINVNNNNIKLVDNKVRKFVEDDDVPRDKIIKRPKLKSFVPISERINKLVHDRLTQRCHEKELSLKNDDSVFAMTSGNSNKRQKYNSISEEFVLFEKCDYGNFDKCDADSPKGDGHPDFEFPEPKYLDDSDALVPSASETDRFRYRFDSAASMVFHTKTGLPLTSSPAPLKRGSNCFDFDDSINGVSGIKSALFHPIQSVSTPRPQPRPSVANSISKPKFGSSAGLLGTFEESALKGRLEPVATVHGFTAELGASGAHCPPHRTLPVTVFFYAPGEANAPYMGHINLGSTGYRVSRSGTIQVSLFNPHGTLVKMFVVLYDLTSMPPATRTFLRQRTLYLPAGCKKPPLTDAHKYMRYLIHLRFMTSKSGKLYLHTDIRIIVSRKADVDTATAHSQLVKSTNHSKATNGTANQEPGQNGPTNQSEGSLKAANSKPCRVFGGSSNDFEFGYENQNGVSYELRSFTYGPENPKYSPR